jgi:hypothetical protein
MLWLIISKNVCYFACSAWPITCPLGDHVPCITALGTDAFCNGKLECECMTGTYYDPTLEQCMTMGTGGKSYLYY